MRGKRKTTGNRTYRAYSISLTHLTLESGDIDDPLALDLDSHFAVDLHSHTTEQEVSNSTEYDLIALRATLTTRQEALDQREHGLAAGQERIEGMDERVREV